MHLIKLIPMGIEKLTRRPEDRQSEGQTYQTIPVLAALGAKVEMVARKLDHEGRESLLYPGKQSHELRGVRVAGALKRRNECENFKPDLDYMKGAEPLGSEFKQRAELIEDEWNKPA